MDAIKDAEGGYLESPTMPEIVKKYPRLFDYHGDMVRQR